ncbi:hypothetical protein GL218_05368 [Daldinia childiae]|uniref:uncharacterized protein n=1 Tax=Daldinia childiae TaxID=326645 RepID=UPI001447CB39|nr:uncharacterized protein GL218_05368 [Daldinia childiae]KAF3058308.1 hypothetical protein GL218_05368 [Daldinia childiae]
MGFALSQAMFPGVIILSSRRSPNPFSNKIVAISFSTEALIALLSLLLILILAIIGLGLKRAPTASLASGEAKGNPMVLSGGSCSAVISAKCHNHDIITPGLAIQGDDRHLWLRPIAWGVVEEGVGMRPGRCGFSASGTGCVDAGRNYV